jgi:hypothetical protein
MIAREEEGMRLGDDERRRGREDEESKGEEEGWRE